MHSRKWNDTSSSAIGSGMVSFHWLHDIIDERKETLVNLLEYSCASSVVN